MVIKSLIVFLALTAQFDHLVVAVRSLSEGVAEFERLTGVKALIGGQHPGRGTENALVSLGGGKYLEIIAPQENAVLSPRDEGMRSLDHLRIIGWAVSVSDAGAADVLKTAGLATTPPQPGSRITPAGDTLQWTTLGFADQTMAMAPFLINWSASTKHPSTTSPGGCALTNFTVADAPSDKLAAALKALGVSGITYVNNGRHLDATLTCGSRTITLTSALNP